MRDDQPIDQPVRILPFKLRAPPAKLAEMPSGPQAWARTLLDAYEGHAYYARQTVRFGEALLEIDRRIPGLLTNAELVPPMLERAALDAETAEQFAERIRANLGLPPPA